MESGRPAGGRSRWMLGLFVACMLFVMQSLPVPADSKTAPPIQISAAKSPVAGKPADLRIDTLKGSCVRGKARVTISKERRAFPFLFVSYLPQGELLQATVPVAGDRASFSYLFWDEGSYRISVNAECGVRKESVKGYQLIVVGTPADKAGRTAILLAGILISGLVSGYLVAGMRRGGP